MPGNEALERLENLLSDGAPVDPAFFSRLLQALVRRAGPEGEQLFSGYLVRERDPVRAQCLISASVGALGVRAVGALRDMALRWFKDEERVEAAASVLGHLGTPEAYDVLTRLATRGGERASPALAAALDRIEKSHPTRYQLLPRLKALGTDAGEARRLSAQLCDAADNELVPLLMDAWDSLTPLARRVVLSVMEKRGDSLAGHLIQGEIEAAAEGEPLLYLCKALRGILERHPQSAQGYESLWQGLWSVSADNPDLAKTSSLVLTANPDPEYSELYREFLRSPLEEVRLAGLRALAAVPDPEAHDALVASLEAASEEEMAGALEALVSLGDEETLEKWARTSDSSRRRGVARICLRALRPDLWADLLADRDHSVSGTALEAWQEAPSGARPSSREVVQLLKGSPAAHVFQRACRILASIGEVDAVPVLAKCLKKGGALRLSALRTLKALKLRKVYAWAKLGALTQTAILRALEDGRDPEALSFLSTLASDLPPEVLSRVRGVLKQSGDRAKDPDAEDPAVQEIAELIYAGLLERIDAKERKEFATGEIRRLIEAPPARADQHCQAVRRVSSLWCKPELGLEDEVCRHVEGFMSGVSLDKTSPQLARREAILALGKRGGAESVAGIMGLLNHPVEVLADAAREAVTALARRNPTANLARLRSSQDVRAQVVLVAEDEPEVRALYQNFLNQNGLTTLGAADGDEVLRAVEAKGVGVVVLDLDMPRRNGFDVLAALKTGPFRPPVVVVTGLSDQGSIVRAQSLGAAEFLRKPVDLLELLDRIRRVAPWEMPLTRPP